MKPLIIMAQRISWSLGVTFASAASALIAVSALDHLDLLAPDSAFYGIDSLPAQWLAALAVLAAVFLELGESHRMPVCMLAGTALYFGSFGDFSFVPFDRAGKPASASTGPCISVATLNIERFATGVERGVHAIQSLDADIVLLGENTLSPSDVAAYDSIIHPYLMVVGHKNSTAILTRYPLDSWKEVELPTREPSPSNGDEPTTMDRNPHRTFVHAVVRIHSIPVHVISVRFIAGQSDDQTLKEQLRWGRYLLRAQKEEAAFLLSYLHSLAGPVIFGGDLNATPGCKTIRPIQACATDAYLEHHLWGAPTFRTDVPTRRLDYLFCMNGVVALESDRLPASASNHFPVRARFAIPTRAPVGEIPTAMAYRFPS